MTIRFQIKNYERAENTDVLRVRIVNSKTLVNFGEAKVIESGGFGEFIVHKGQSVVVEHGHRHGQRRTP